MTSASSLHTPCMIPLKLRIARLLPAAGYAVALAALLLVFALYLQPDFMVTLANQVWACF